MAFKCSAVATLVDGSENSTFINLKALTHELWFSDTDDTMRV